MMENYFTHVRFILCLVREEMKRKKHSRAQCDMELHVKLADELNQIMCMRKYFRTDFLNGIILLSVAAYYVCTHTESSGLGMRRKPQRIENIFMREFFELAN